MALEAMVVTILGAVFQALKSFVIFLFNLCWGKLHEHREGVKYCQQQVDYLHRYNIGPLVRDVNEMQNDLKKSKKSKKSKDISFVPRDDTIRDAERRADENNPKLSSSKHNIKSRKIEVLKDYDKAKLVQLCVGLVLFLALVAALRWEKIPLTDIADSLNLSKQTKDFILALPWPVICVVIVACFFIFIILNLTKTDLSQQNAKIQKVEQKISNNKQDNEEIKRKLREIKKVKENLENEDKKRKQNNRYTVRFKNGVMSGISACKDMVSGWFGY